MYVKHNAVSIRFEDDQLAEIDRLAKKDNRSRANWIEHMVLLQVVRRKAREQTDPATVLFDATPKSGNRAVKKDGRKVAGQR